MQIDELPAGEQNQCPDMDMNRVWVRINPDNHLIIRVFCFYRAY